MKIGIYSDLHLDFDRNPYSKWEKDTKEWDYTPEPDVFYINAGDTSSVASQRHAFFAKHPDDFVILGNHDYYSERDVNKGDPPLYNYTIRTGRQGPDFDNVAVAGATMWTDLVCQDDWAQYCFCLIDQEHFHGGPWSQEKYVGAHVLQKDYLMESKAEIIVSHHSPSYLSSHKKYIGSKFNASFHTEMAYEIMDMPHPPKLWIHGHTHDASDYMIGTTRVICHPRGYPGEPDHKNYQPKIVEI
jgi:predicted phosphodiesterase